jgi:hypothetical protein
MPVATFMLNITPIPLVSFLLWALIGLVSLYLARRPFHQVVEAISRLIYNSIRLAATALKMSCHQLQTLNREVLMADGIEQAERQAERDLERISEMVRRKLATYPQLERQISERLLAMEADYRKSAEIPQDLPNWVNVINAIAAIKSSDDPMVLKIIQDIHLTLKSQYKVALEGHRKAISTRHSILSRMIPRWNSTEKRLKKLEIAIAQLADHTRAVDRSMAVLEAVRSGEEKVERRLYFSSLTQFFTSSLILGVFTAGAIINFKLIALPMAEMVGGHSYIAGFNTPDIAGVVIVCLQVVLGIFLMDATRVTRLFRLIGDLNDNKRAWFFWGALAMLTILAGVESWLAFIRDRITADMQALRQSLAGLDSPAMATTNIAVIGQMILGALLPLILALAAIPIESFIRSSRTLVGMVSVLVLRILTVLLRLIGNLGYYTGRSIVRIYDLIIFPAIWLEDWVHRRLDIARGLSKTTNERFVATQGSNLKVIKETVVCKKSSD